MATPVGLLVLGPKRNGLPYEDEEVAFLGALSSVAMLTLHSAGIQQTLERLNLELRDKVDKIAEQQRRILLLQDQLTDRGQAAGRPRRRAAVRPGGVRPDPRVRGRGPVDARGGPQGRGEHVGRPDPGRKRHRQGAAGRGDPLGRAACERAVRPGPLRGAVAGAARKRAVRPRQGGVHRRRSRPGRAVRAGQRAGPCSSTRSATSTWRCRPSSSGSCRRWPSSGWAARRRSASTSGSSRRRTRISKA